MEGRHAAKGVGGWEEKLGRNNHPHQGAPGLPSQTTFPRPKSVGKLRGPSVVSLPSRELPQITETQPSQQLSPQSELQEGGERGLASY